METNKNFDLTNEILEMLNDEAANVTDWLRKTHNNEVQLGKYLESAWVKLKDTKNRGKVFKAWTAKTMGHKKTKAADARKLYKLVCIDFEGDLEKVAPHYLAAVKTSQLRYALSKLKAQRKSKDGKRDINLKDIGFQDEAMMLFFHQTDEVFDLRDLTLAKLKSLVDPKYSPAIDRNSLDGLRSQEETLEKRLMEIRQRICDLDSSSVAA